MTAPCGSRPHAAEQRQLALAQEAADGEVGADPPRARGRARRAGPGTSGRARQSSGSQTAKAIPAAAAAATTIRARRSRGLRAFDPAEPAAGSATSSATVPAMLHERGRERDPPGAEAVEGEVEERVQEQVSERDAVGIQFDWRLKKARFSISIAPLKTRPRAERGEAGGDNRRLVRGSTGRAGRGCG